MNTALVPYEIHLRISAIRNEVQAEASRIRAAGVPAEPNPRKTAIYALEDSLNTVLSVAQILFDIDLVEQEVT